MIKYYTDWNGRLFCAYKDYSDRQIVKEFSRELKDWKYAERQKQMTEITRAEAIERLQIFLLDGLDSRKLQKYIDLLCRNRKTEWEPVVEREDGVPTLEYPRYPIGLFDIFSLLGFDNDYRFEMENWPINLLPTNMNVLQIRTALTYLHNNERFYEGEIAGALDDGTLLKMLLRLEDLLNAHQKKEQHW